MKHKGWHHRGYLPHLDVPGLIQGLTFRLYDSVPLPVIAAWKQELEWIEDRAGADAGKWEEQRAELHRRIARYEDACHGECHLGSGAVGARNRNEVQIAKGN